MAVDALNDPKQGHVHLKPEIGISGHFLGIADDNTLMASKKREGFAIIFKMIVVSTKCENVEYFVALQVDDKYFLSPKKPKDISTDDMLKLRPKEIERSKIFDKEKCAIARESRKYWFRMKTVDAAHVYESLAYPGFYMSVEDKDVLMRQCPEEFPNDQNYQLQVSEVKGEEATCAGAEVTEAIVATGGTSECNEACKLLKSDDPTKALQHFGVDKEEITEEGVATDVRSETEIASEIQENSVICQHVEEKAVTISTVMGECLNQGVEETDIVGEEIRKIKLIEVE